MIGAQILAYLVLHEQLLILAGVICLIGDVIALVYAYFKGKKDEKETDQPAVRRPHPTVAFDALSRDD